MIRTGSDHHERQISPDYTLAVMVKLEEKASLYTGNQLHEALSAQFNDANTVVVIVAISSVCMRTL